MSDKYWLNALEIANKMQTLLMSEEYSIFDNNLLSVNKFNIDTENKRISYTVKLFNTMSTISLYTQEEYYFDLDTDIDEEIVIYNQWFNGWLFYKSGNVYKFKDLPQ